MSGVPETAPARRRQEDRREEAKARILDAAVRLTAEKGLDNFTLAEVGEAAGYSRGLPGHYFGSKDELLIAIARHVVHSFRSRFRAGNSVGEGLDSLIALVEFYFHVSEEDLTRTRALHRVLAKALDNAGLAALLTKLNRRSRDGFGFEITAGVASGAIRKDVDVESLAVIILATLRGVNALCLLDPGIDQAAVRRTFVDMLRRSLAA